MQLLLTSGGVSNPTIHRALEEMLGKPISEASALFIPTALYGLSIGARQVYNDIQGHPHAPFCNLGWKSFGILELTALPTLKETTWQPTVRETDVLLVGGGDPTYLAYWMHESGFAGFLPSLRMEQIYMGLSAGSMVAGPDFGGDHYGGLNLPEGHVPGLGLVDFAFFPHLDYPGFEYNTRANAEKWAAKRTVPTYVVDDQTAIKVVNGQVEVLSEGNWFLANGS